jgi:hypothetical protein
MVTDLYVVDYHPQSKQDSCRGASHFLLEADSQLAQICLILPSTSISYHESRFSATLWSRVHEAKIREKKEQYLATFLTLILQYYDNTHHLIILWRLVSDVVIIAV